MFVINNNLLLVIECIYLPFKIFSFWEGFLLHPLPCMGPPRFKILDRNLSTKVCRYLQVDVQVAFFLIKRVKEEKGCQFYTEFDGAWDTYR